MVKQLLGDWVGVAVGKGIKRVSILRLVSYLCWGLILIAVAPFSSYPIWYGVDYSWIYFINKYHYFAIDNPYKFGVDTFFTYGPLGFLWYPNHGRPTYLIAVVFQLAYWALLAGLLWKKIRQEHFSGGKLLVVLFALLFLFQSNANVFLVPFFLVIVSILENPNGKLWRWAFVLFTCCLMFYVKFSAGILFTATAAALYLVLIATKQWKIFGKPTAVGLFFFSIVLPGMYLVYAPSLKGFFHYFLYSLEFSRGYSAAMSLPSGLNLLPVAALYAILFGVFALYLYISQKSIAWAGAIFLPGLFFAFKAGFVRLDMSHIVDFFNFFAISLSAAYVFVEKQKALRILGAVLVLGSLLTFTLFHRSAYFAYLSNSLTSSVNGLAGIPQAWAATKQEPPLDVMDVTLDDALKAIVGKDAVLVVPQHLLLAPSNGLHLAPTPVLQGYAAYTPTLDALDADFLEQADHNPFLLFDFESIDDRNPFTDTPALWQSIIRWYDVRYQSESVILFERRSNPKAGRLVKIKSVSAAKTDSIDVPQREHAVIAKIFLDDNLPGKIYQFLYRIPPVYMDITRESGKDSRIRVIPATLSGGVLINTLPTDIDETALLFETGQLEHTDRFQFTGEGLEFINPTIRIDFYEVVAP